MNYNYFLGALTNRLNKSELGGLFYYNHIRSNDNFGTNIVAPPRNL